MNFLLLDDAGEVMARSRSLAALQSQHAGKAQQHYARQSTLTTGARRWEFGDLPERIDATPGGRRQLGYPALVDEGDSVGVRVFATPPEARSSHQRGCARLIRLALSREFKSLRRDLPVNVQGELVYRGLAAHPQLDPDLLAGRDLRDDLLDRVAMTVFLEGHEPLRSAAAFDTRIDAHRGAIAAAGQEIARTVQMSLERVGRIQAALVRAPAATGADARAQLAWLVPAGFLQVTPWERLQEFTRYLQALEQRLEKAGRDPRRDAQLAAQIAPLEARYRELVRVERGLRPPGEDPYRWLLEEFRVSLFAQQLRTRVTVSARRLEDAWIERERAASVP
jgi:ATP-dependent helicase HrpA